MTTCRVFNIIGATFGWAGALTLAAVPILSHERTVPAMLLLLSVALFTSACLVMQRHQRPIGSAFELGYTTGRRDAIREASERGRKVVPLRQTVGS